MSAQAVPASSPSEGAADPERIVALAGDVKRTAIAELAEIQKITGRTKILALDGIEIIDRNLDECSCDVRRRATDSAVVACAQAPMPEAAAFAAERLGVILAA